MADFAIPIDDLHTLMLDHPEWRAADGVHYNADGQQVQATVVAAAIRDLLPTENT